MYRLMVVDDSAIIRNKLGCLSQDSPFELVATATNAEDALSCYEEATPDVLTMDLSMPDMDGITCIERLNAMDPEVRILVISSMTDKFTGIEALTKGAQGFLKKPFSDADLMAALHEIMN